MRAVLVSLILMMSHGSALAQSQQQAGADGGQADAAFQELIAKCDDTDVLLLRGKTRLLLGRTTPEAAEQAQQLINEGLAKCGEGDIEAAKAKINEGYELAQAGATEKFGTDASAEKTEEAASIEAASENEAKGEEKPWWKFW